MKVLDKNEVKNHSNSHILNQLTIHAMFKSEEKRDFYVSMIKKEYSDVQIRTNNSLEEHSYFADIDVPDDKYDGARQTEIIAFARSLSEKINKS